MLVHSCVYVFAPSHRIDRCFSFVCVYVFAPSHRIDRCFSFVCVCFYLLFSGSWLIEPFFPFDPVEKSDCSCAIACCSMGLTPMLRCCFAHLSEHCDVMLCALVSDHNSHQ